MEAAAVCTDNCRRRITCPAVHVIPKIVHADGFHHRIGLLAGLSGALCQRKRRTDYHRKEIAADREYGDVRAWRGDNLLLTPELTGERTPQGDQLAATRGVKTVWIPGESASASLSSPPPAATGGAKPAAAGPPGKATSSPTSAPAPAPTAQGAATAAGNAAAGNAAAGKPAAGTAPPAPASAAAGKPAAASSTTAAGAATTTIAPAAAKPATGPGGVPHSNGPITVLSTDMTYHDGSGILIYKGNVHVDQDGKTLTCHQLDVYLDVNHKAKQMTCTGDTHFDDPSTGRKIDGESAIYRVEARKVDVVGEVVTMHDREGNIVHGQRMRYNLDDGKVVVLGKDDGPKVGAAPGGTP